MPLPPNAPAALQDTQDAVQGVLAQLLQQEGASFELYKPETVPATKVAAEMGGFWLHGTANGVPYAVWLDVAWADAFAQAMLGESIPPEEAPDLLGEAANQALGAIRTTLNAADIQLPETALQALPSGSPAPALPDPVWRIPFTLDGLRGMALLPQSAEAALAPAVVAQPAAAAQPAAPPPTQTPTAGMANMAASMMSVPEGPPMGGAPVEVSPAQFMDFGGEHVGDGSSAGSPSLGLLQEVELEVTVELGRRKLPLSDLLRLTTGSVIELEKLVGEPLAVYANGRLIAEGEAVVIDEQFGVRITNLASAQRRQKAFF